MSATRGTDYRLTAADEQRIDTAIRHAFADAGMATDTTHLQRVAAHAIGCSLVDLRDVEREHITRRVDVLALLEQHPSHDREGWNGRENGPGYAYARDLWAMSADGDAWGTLMAHYFAVAEVLYLRTGEMVADYRPGPAVDVLRRAVREEGADPYEGPDGDWPACDLWEALDRIAADDGRTAWLDGYREWAAWCAVEADVLKAEGRDY